MCLKNGESCDCSRNAGGIQTEFIVECKYGPFNYVSNPNGFRLSVGPMAPCAEVKRCETSGGSQIGCGSYDPQTMKCTIPPEPPCGWHLFGPPTQAATFVQGEPCRPAE